MSVPRTDILAFLDVIRTCRRVGRVRIAEKAREEVALHGWEDEDVYLFLDDLGPDDFLRREAPRYGAFDAIWVFTPEIVQPEGPPLDPARAAGHDPRGRRELPPRELPRRGVAMNPIRPASCDHGECAARLDDTTVRVRRGERVLAVPQKLWSCERCRDPDTGEAMRFVDASLGEANRALADAAWREHFGEPLPAGQKPGRKPAEPLEERVIAMLSKAELARLDAARGERSRSEFLRDAARRLVEAVEQQKAG